MFVVKMYRYPKFEYGVCYRDKSDKKQKKTLNISVFCCF